MASNLVSLGTQPIPVAEHATRWVEGYQAAYNRLAEAIGKTLARIRSYDTQFGVERKVLSGLYFTLISKDNEQPSNVTNEMLEEILLENRENICNRQFYLPPNQIRAVFSDLEVFKQYSPKAFIRKNVDDSALSNKKDSTLNIRYIVQIEGDMTIGYSSLNGRVFSPSHILQEDLEVKADGIKLPETRDFMKGGVSQFNEALALYDIRDSARALEKGEPFMNLGHARLLVMDTALRYLISILDEREVKAKELIQSLESLKAAEQAVQPSLFQ